MKRGQKSPSVDMNVAHRWEDLAGVAGPMTMALGFFDGVHRGHQAVLRAAIERAAEWPAQAWVLTFNPHPLKVLRPQEAPRLLTSNEHKLRLMREAGMQGCLVLPFTAELAGREPEEFLQDLCTAAPQLKEIIAGTNWTFGRRARGNADLLRTWSAPRGIAVTLVPPVEWQGQPVSSTRIRRAVQEGDLEAARAMLGRPFSILGTVVKGKQLGGQLGFPTANVDPHNEVRPPPGVYDVRAAAGADQWGGAAFLDEGPPSGSGAFEVHLLDFSGDLYGRHLEVFFTRYLRGVERFATLEELQAQIARDVARVRASPENG